MKNDKGKKGRERERGRSEPPKKKQAFALRREKYNISTDDRAAVGISMDQVNVFCSHSKSHFLAVAYGRYRQVHTMWDSIPPQVVPSKNDLQLFIA